MKAFKIEYLKDLNTSQILSIFFFSYGPIGLSHGIHKHSVPLLDSSSCPLDISLLIKGDDITTVSNHFFLAFFHSILTAPLHLLEAKTRIYVILDNWT